MARVGFLLVSLTAGSLQERWSPTFLKSFFKTGGEPALVDSAVTTTIEGTPNEIPETQVARTDPRPLEEAFIIAKVVFGAEGKVVIFPLEPAPDKQTIHPAEQVLIRRPNFIKTLPEGIARLVHL